MVARFAHIIRFSSNWSRHSSVQDTENDPTQGRWILHCLCWGSIPRGWAGRLWTQKTCLSLDCWLNDCFVQHICCMRNSVWHDRRDLVHFSFHPFTAKLSPMTCHQQQTVSHLFLIIKNMSRHTSKPPSASLLSVFMVSLRLLRQCFFFFQQLTNLQNRICMQSCNALSLHLRVKYRTNVNAWRGHGKVWNISLSQTEAMTMAIHLFFCVMYHSVSGYGADYVVCHKSLCCTRLKQGWIAMNQVATCQQWIDSVGWRKKRHKSLSVTTKDLHNTVVRVKRVSDLIYLGMVSKSFGSDLIFLATDLCC